MPAKRIATLLIIKRNGRFLFGTKKKAEIGTGKLNSCGGKVEKGENIPTAAVRETEEELGVVVREEDLDHLGILECYADGEPFQDVYVYLTESFSGEPSETDSMVPEWIDECLLPLHYSRMHEADQYWLGAAVAGQRFRCTIWYERPGEGYLGHYLTLA